MKRVRSNIRRIWGEIKWAALSAMWLITLSLGYFGFTVYANENSFLYSILDRVYLSLQLISMNSGAVEGNVNWMLETSRFLLPVLTAFTAFQAIINLFREQTQWLHLWGLHDHIIVCGLGRKGRYLVDDLLSKGQHSVVIEKNLDPTTANDYRRKGVIVIEGDALDTEILQRARLYRASHLICLLGNDQQNLSIALQAHQLVQGNNKHRLTCIIHLVSEDLIDLVKNSELNIDKDDPFILEIFNTYKRQALQLINKDPFQHAIMTEQPSNLLVIGMGRLGQNIIHQAAYNWYTREHSGKLKITVIDRDASDKITRLLQDYPQIGSVCTFQPIQIDLNSSSMIRNALTEHKRNLTAEVVYICLGNTILGIKVSLTLMQVPQLSKVPFYIRLEKNSGLFNLLNNPISGQTNKGLIVPFDIFEQTCSADLIIGGLHELLAIKLRENYLENLDQRNAEGLRKIHWKEISEEEKEANRQQANRICHLLNACGYSINPLHNWDAGKFSFEPEEAQLMAKMEHELWSQWKRNEGWQFGSQRDNKMKLHPDLVPWEKLPTIEKKKNENFIIKLPALLAEIGFQINK